MATISNSNSNTLIVGTADDDFIYNDYNYVTIDGGTGDDYILSQSFGENISINGVTGNDTIQNSASTVTILGGIGDDSINNFHGKLVTIYGGVGNDSIENYGMCDSVLIDGGDGTDYISNSGSSVTINSGNDNDLITNHGSNVTIDGGAGNDSIVTESDVGENTYVYTEGDGHDTIQSRYITGSSSYSDNYTLQINSSVGWSSLVSGNNIVVTVGDGSITLVDAATSSGININGVTYPIDNTDTDNNVTDNNVTDNNVTDNNVTDNNVTDNNVTDNNGTDNNVTDNNVTDNNVTDNNVTDNNGTDNNGTDNNVTDNNVTDNNVTDNNVTDNNVTDTPVTLPPDTPVTPETLPPAVGGAAYDIVFFVDVSGSMETYINQVNAIAQTFVDKLKERGITDYRLAVVDYETAFNVYFGADGSPFTQDVDTFKSWMAQAAEKSKQHLGNENALYAINHVLNNFAFNPTANKEFIVLTDENFYDGQTFDLDVTEQFMAANDVQLDVIGRVDGSCDSAWTPVARNTGGNFYDINGNYTETFNEIVLNLDCVNVNLSTVPDGQTGWFFLVPGNHVTDMKSVDAVFVNAADPNLEGYTQLYGQPVGAVTADKVYSGNMSAYRQKITIPDMWNVTGTSHADILNVAGTGFGVVIASGDGHDAVKLDDAATGIILTDHDLKNDGLEFARRQALGTFTENVTTDLGTMTNQVAITSPTMAVYLQNFSSPLQEEFDAKNEQFMAYGVTNAGTTNTVYDLLFGTEPTPEPSPESVTPVAPPIVNDALMGRIMFAQWGYGFTPPPTNPLYDATTDAATETTASTITTETLATSADLGADFGSPSLDEIAPANFAVTQDDFAAQNFNVDFAVKQANKLLTLSKPKFC